MPSVRLAGLSVLLALLATPAPELSAQTEGPLKIKIPKPRPPRSERPPASRTDRPRREPTYEEERPVLKRKDAPEEEVVPPASSGACPEGYIEVQVAAEDDERPPRLTRGGSSDAEEPRERKVEVECVFSETVVDEDGKVIDRRSPESGSGDPFIEEVRLKVFTFSESLPNFVCDQITDRYYSTTSPPKWKKRDRVEAEVLYIEGEEKYQNIRRNGREIRSPQSSGAWSTGEFGTLMMGLFHPRSQADFTLVRDSEVGGVETRVYDYAVAEKNSQWRVRFEGQEILPAYKGSVWIDPEAKRVMRIEMTAQDIPSDFPLDTLEMSVEYGPVEIGGREYLLTQNSENLGCQRYSRNCTKNKLEFRNYRKFTAESTISTTDSTVTYGGQEPVAPPKQEP